MTPGDGLHSSWYNGIVNATYEEKIDLGARVSTNDVVLVTTEIISVQQYMGETPP